MSNTIWIALILVAGVGGFIAGAAVTQRTMNPLNWFR